jgi:hypothetical protein
MAMAGFLPFSAIYIELYYIFASIWGHKVRRGRRLRRRFRRGCCRQRMGRPPRIQQTNQPTLVSHPPTHPPTNRQPTPAPQVYTIYSILFIVFLILIVVTSFITVALTYFQLAVEDHRWWWRSFLCGGSTAFFVLGYCFFYYNLRWGGDEWS